VTAAVGEADAGSDTDEGAMVNEVPDDVTAKPGADAEHAVPASGPSRGDASTALPLDDLGLPRVAKGALDRPASDATPTTDSNPQADPWAAILEAGAALLQGLAASRGAGGTGPAMPPIQIERDPVTGQASVRLPLPDPAVLQKLAKAFEPWLR
jgi:hypothetical protein